MDKKRLLYLQNRIAYARDHFAYKELYLYFHPSIYKFTQSIVQQETLVEEIVSDVMICVWTMESKLAYVDHLKAYLFTAARNTAISYLKQNKKDSYIEIDENCAKSGPLPEEQLLNLELTHIIKLTVSALPQKCQQAYRLIKEESFSYKEACQILGISQKTLEAHMCIALKKIRSVLASYLSKKNI